MGDWNEELSLQDVEFLQAVRYIEEHPDEFPSVDPEEGQATTEALNKVLKEKWSSVNEWSDRKVSYRMNQPGKGDGSRGWGVDGGFGLVRLYQAELSPESGWTSRKVELTDKGRKRLSVAEENMGVARSSDEGDGAAELDSTATENELRLSELEDRVDELGEEIEQTQQMIESIAADVNSFKESESGAISGEMDEQLTEVFNRMVQHTRMFRSVLGVDTGPFASDASPTEQEYQLARQQVRTTLFPNEGGQREAGPQPQEPVEQQSAEDGSEQPAEK